MEERCISAAELVKPFKKNPFVQIFQIKVLFLTINLN